MLCAFIIGNFEISKIDVCACGQNNLLPPKKKFGV